MTQEHKFDLKISKDDEDVAYLKLPGHPGTKSGVVKKSVSLRDLFGEYSGPDIILDFSEGKKLIGIEIIG
jgi:hypothetical protein